MRNVEHRRHRFRIPQSSFRIHQFSSKRFGEQAGRELVDAGVRGGEARVELAGVGEESFDAADDFVLLGKRGQPELKCGKFLGIDV